MSGMSNIQTKLQTEQWVAATWDEYLQAIADISDENARCYYNNKHLRIEMSPIGPAHSRDNGIIVIAVSIFGIAKLLPLNLLINCSYRKTGLQECQPDASYYIGDRAQLVTKGSSVVNLDRYPPPDLVIEVSDTTLADDLGAKRLLYETFGASEYWVVDVQNNQVFAFACAEGGSKRITESQVLPGLAIALLDEALRRSRQTDQTQVGVWLLSEFQASDQT